MHFIGNIAVVHIHMRQTRAKTCGQCLHIFRPVAHVKTDLVPNGRAVFQHEAAEIVGPAAHLGPCNFAIPMHQRQMTFRQNRNNRVQNIAKIPRHQLPSQPVSIGVKLEQKKMTDQPKKIS